MAMLVRVRCVDDGRELLIEGRRLEWRVQVGTIKRLVLEQRRQQRAGARDQEVDEEEALGGSYLLSRGQILADSDMVNLFSLTPSDFFVFVQEPEQVGAAGGAIEQAEAPRKRPVDPRTRRQLLEMGFTTAQVDGALSCGEAELEQLVEHIMSGSNGEPTLAQRSELQAHAAADPEMRELQQRAMTDPFDAVMFLKERFSADALASLTDNPASTIQTLRQATARPKTQPSTTVEDAPRYSPAFDADAQEETKAGGDGDGSGDPIERLAAMGFARDLVVAMFESCGFDEELTANALLQTLET